MDETAETPAEKHPERRLLRRLRPYRLGIGFTVAAAAVTSLGLALPGSASHPGPGPVISLPAPGGGPSTAGSRPAQLELAAYDSCDSMLDGLRAHAADHVTAYGPAGGGYGDVRMAVPSSAAAGSAEPGLAAKGAEADAPAEHSGTNVQEVGVDEPDIVKTDGRRVVSVAGGVLRVVDATTRELTGTLDLGLYAGAEGAQLLLDADRALVVLGDSAGPYAGPIAYDRAYPASGIGTGSTFLLVDVAGPPSVIGSLHTNGGYVDARLVDGTARVVVDSAPKLAFPVMPDASETTQLAANRAAIERAPLSAWQPAYQVSDGRTSTTRTVPCGDVSHPVNYTGESLLTVYSVDLAGTLDDTHPVTVAADAATVYASAHDLYVASSDGRRTHLHRFFIGAPGRPTYLGSGSVPGQLLNSYSLSDYAGTLRVVTTDYGLGRPGIDSQGASSETSLYVLDANTLARRGQLDGLGIGENLHAVRFLGPLAYVVTYESVDPLYVLDLADPSHPRKAGELEVTGYSDYLHPVGAGRVLGVGQDVDDEQRVAGQQVSLFDVSDASDPRRVANLVRHHTPSETPIDPHAFLWWPATRTAVVPIDSWETTQSGAAVVVHVGRNHLSVQGTIRNPAVVTAGDYDTGIQRTLVIGATIWTMSGSGLQVSDLDTLHREAWVAFA